MTLPKHQDCEETMLHIEGPEGLGLFYATPDSAGFDIRANEAAILEPGQIKAVATGLRITSNQQAFKIPMGQTNSPNELTSYIAIPELQIRPRSGLALKSGITVLNSPGTIDADYRGEIKVILINHGQRAFHIEIGDRIAQAVCQLAIRIPQIPLQQLQRGEGGFGSTGHK
jgi:dUTP pyrophosphatase